MQVAEEDWIFSTPAWLQIYRMMWGIVIVCLSNSRWMWTQNAKWNCRVKKFLGENAPWLSFSGSLNLNFTHLPTALQNPNYLIDTGSYCTNPRFIPKDFKCHRQYILFLKSHRPPGLLPTFLVIKTLKNPQKDVQEPTLRYLDLNTNLVLIVRTPSQVFLQELWRQNIGLDAVIPQRELDTWHKWLLSIPQLTSIRFPSCYFATKITCQTIELHLFCDASEVAYSASAYLRITCDHGAVHYPVCANV